MSNEFIVATINVNGISEHWKRREFFYYLHQKNIDIVFVQESHSTQENERRWSSEFGNKIWFDHGSSNSKGVMILINKKLNITVHNMITSKQGRYILLYVTILHRKWLLVNIYAPNIDTPTFFEELTKEVNRFTLDHLLMAGDLNFAMDVNIDRLGTTCNNDRSGTWFKSYMENNNIVYTWRYRYPDRQGFTWRRKGKSLKCSRLDYFCVSEEVTQFIDKMNTNTSIHSDHAQVEMYLKMCEDSRGNGYWKLNVSLLRDVNYIDSMNKLLDIELENNLDLKFREQWELVKLAVWGSTIQFASRKQKSMKQKIQVLEIKLKKLEKERIQPAAFFRDTEEQIRLVKNELHELIKKRRKVPSFGHAPDGLIMLRCHQNIF